MSYQILIVDDDHLMAKSISRGFESEGFSCSVVCSGEEALKILKKAEFNLVLLDLSLPGIDGFQTMEVIKKDSPEVPVIILTASQNIHDAIKAVKLGADDYLIKSTDIEELRIALRKSIKSCDLAKENILLKKQFKEKYYQDYILFPDNIKSPKMQEVYQLIERVAGLEKSTVLVTGESGTGKELVARTIHHLGPRAEKPFIDISCSALPSSLIESELFGFEKGAFTDAKSHKQGLLELSDGGTLFLDEIATLDLSIQSKLLRFLEQRSFRRIGGTIDHRVDLRVLAATNCDLKKKIISHEFREDLFYRLNVFPIIIPPLRERKEDIIPITQFYIKKYNQEFHKNIKGLHQNSILLLIDYEYPGNVRELKNIIERAMIMEEGDIITPSSLHFQRGEAFFAEPITTESLNSSYATDHPEDQNVFPTLIEIEKRHILRALHRANGNKALAAKILGIGRSTLFRKLEGFE